MLNVLVKIENFKIPLMPKIPQTHEDRAKYGKNLLENLSKPLATKQTVVRFSVPW
jgi:hypothetical protein